MVAHGGPGNVSKQEAELKPFVCPAEPCQMHYHTKDWLARHVEQCHLPSELGIAGTAESEALAVKEEEEEEVIIEGTQR